MDASTAQQLITTLGFPIVCVIALGYFVYKIWLQTNESAKSREERMFAQLDKFSNSLDNFNTTLIRIDTRLDAVERKFDSQKNEEK